MEIKFSTSKPIYQQIMEEIMGMVVRGQWPPGTKLPSQKELAGKIGVNHNTIQRVYRELEQEGFVETLRGQGTFVSNKENLLKVAKDEMIRRAMEEFVDQMQALGMTGTEILGQLEGYLKRKGDLADGTFNC